MEISNWNLEKACIDKHWRTWRIISNIVQNTHHIPQVQRMLQYHILQKISEIPQEKQSYKAILQILMSSFIQFMQPQHFSVCTNIQHSISDVSTQGSFFKCCIFYGNNKCFWIQLFKGCILGFHVM